MVVDFEGARAFSVSEDDAGGGGLAAVFLGFLLGEGRRGSLFSV